VRSPRFLPRGWGDFLFQLSLWFGFILAYQVARGIADRGPLEAFQNGAFVIDAEKALHTFIEADLQGVITQSGLLVHAVNVTYWLSQFTVLGLALLWIYLFRTESFTRVRNWVLATNLIALVGYVLMPTAPPRMFPEEGFVDTLAQSSMLNHGSGLIQLAANPYAAMPSVHAADALIVGFAMAMLVRPLDPLAEPGLVLRNGHREPLLARHRRGRRAGRRRRDVARLDGEPPRRRGRARVDRQALVGA
jgi:PAP2 superfamily